MTRSYEHWLRPGVPRTTFCAGCGHGILLHAAIRAADAMNLPRERFLFVSGIGCAAWIPSPNIQVDTLHTLHGRAVAFATGAKAANPELEVLVISGDGDLASIGGNHLIHAARRNTDLAVVCANNEIYGMTGGQTGPTTRAGGITATHPGGNPFAPFNLVRLVLGAGARYAARYAATQPWELSRAIRRALETPGFAFVECVSPCPTQFGRRNRIDSPARLYDELRGRCVSRETARKLSAEARRSRIVTGEWTAEEYEP